MHAYALRWTRPERLLALLSLLAACSGCGRERPPPTSFPVSGLVTFEGQPITGGTVTFYHRSRNGGGLIGTDGRFSVNGDGLPPATYYVAITPPDPFASPPVPGAAPRERPQFPEIPEKYRTPIGSGIELEVKAETNYFVLNMVHQDEVIETPPIDSSDGTQTSPDDAGDPESAGVAPAVELPPAPPSSDRVRLPTVTDGSSEPDRSN